MARRSAEPWLWLLFSAGGVVSALLMPVLVLLLGIAVPLGWLSPPGHGHLLALLHNPLTRLVLLGVCALSLVHWAHRFRYTLQDGLRLGNLGRPISVLCYGGALAGSAVAAWVLWSVP